MKIINVRPAPAGSSVIAHADIELDEGVRIYGIRVSRAEDGTYRAFGQTSDRGRTCSFTPAAVADIAEATILELNSMGHRTNDFTRS